MTRLFSFVLALCLFAAPLSAHADEVTKRAKIEELFNLLHMDQLMKQVMDASESQAATMSAQMFGGDLPAELKPRLDDFQNRMKALIEAQLAWKALKPEYVTLYDNNFTEAQIDDVVAFYKSPTGRAFVEKTPTLTTQGMQIAQARITAIQPQLKQMFDDFLKEVTAATEKKQSK